MNKILENEKRKSNNIKINDPIYNPNMEYTYKKINICTNWNKMTGRKSKLFEDSKKTLDKYYNNTFNSFNINYNNSSSFIDMTKQTQRNGFPINHNLRQRYETKYAPINKKKEYIKWKKICKKPLKCKSPFSTDAHDLKLKVILMRNKNIKFYTNYKPILDKNLSIEKCKSIPDFNRCLSRKYLEKLTKKKIIESNEMYFPKYNLVKERVKMMVKYNQNEKKKKEFNGVKSNEIFDIINSFEQIYGHKLQVAPNFKKMIPQWINIYHLL